jgi:hypothetical protein
MSLKKSLLESAIKEKSLIGIRTESVAWGESVIGFIVELEESYFTLNEIDEYGFLIGKTQIAIEDVINIEIDDRYQKRLLYIYNNNSKFDRNERITIWKVGEELLPSIKALIGNKKIATFYLNEDDYVIGFALKYDKTYVMIKNIGSEGDEDGISFYPIFKFIGLRYNIIEEKKIKLLYENRTLFY